MAEALLAKLGAAKFNAFSAGSAPKSSPNPFALEQVAKLGLSPDAFRSKSWDEFAHLGAPHMHIIITVCDNAAGETCPVWLGHPATAHWGFADPSDAAGSEADKRAAFAASFATIKRHIELLVALPDEKLDHAALAAALQRIHRDADAMSGTAY